MSEQVKLSAKLAGDDDLNGLDALADDLINDPTTPRIAVCWFDVQKIVQSVDDDSEVPYVRIRRFEPIGTAAEMPEGLRAVVEQAAEQRTGKAAIPFDQVDGIEVDE